MGVPLDGAHASALREREQDARRRYQAAIAALGETLRYAEERFGEASSAIDGHIRRACVAAGFHDVHMLMRAASTFAALEEAA